MPELVLGPLLRYVGEREATVWVETDAPAEVEVLGHTARTFQVRRHHYALVTIEGLEPGGSYPYEVHLDGERCWPLPHRSMPPSVIRTLEPGSPMTIAYGSCRVAMPHTPPYSLSKDDDERGFDLDALYVLALEMIRGTRENWPQVLVLLGDQVYVDEGSPVARAKVRWARDTTEPPHEETGTFEEYTWLYHESWGEPTIRWLFSTVSTSMVWDDHDMRDDWNISKSWVEEMNQLDWWRVRAVDGFMSYWVYQHLGNLSPRELEQSELWQRLQGTDDATAALQEFAEQASQTGEGTRWSYCRDFDRTRLVVMDSRAGRVLDEGQRTIVDDEEWDWIAEQANGDFDHLLLATSDPYLLVPALHHLEAWNERVCDGAWGGYAANLGEKMRREVDFDHWGSFRRSFERLSKLIEQVGSGRDGEPPASIVVLSGDVHHAYLAEVAFKRSAGVRSAVYQATCSPFRNPLDSNERRVIEAMNSGPAEGLTRLLARSAGVSDPPIRWRLCEGPHFDNQVGTLKIDGRRMQARLDKTRPEKTHEKSLDRTFEREIA
jgi:phosphodiesterase/alkaline phosphatase D-like protein